MWQLSQVLLAIYIGLGLSGCDPDEIAYPERLVALDGEYYLGEMGGAVLEPELRFAVLNKYRAKVVGAVIQLSLLEGDGTLSADSVIAGPDGIATAGYSFSGDLGHAVIEAIGRNGADTIDVVLRANTLVPGENGQGQYVLLDDLYSDVVAINGPPARVDSIGTIAVAIYEAELGMVVICYDVDFDGVLPPNAPVYGVIVVDSVYWQPPDSTTKSARYGGMTADSIGIGSSYYADVVPIYGNADHIYQDTSDLVLKMVYDNLFLAFWCDPIDTSVFQIDIFEDFDTSVFGAPVTPPENLGRMVQRMVASRPK